MKYVQTVDMTHEEDK